MLIYVLISFTEDPSHPGLVDKDPRVDVVHARDWDRFSKQKTLKEWIDDRPTTFVRVHKLDQKAIKQAGLMRPQRPTKAFQKFLQKQNEVSRNMALLFFWDARALRTLRAGGVCTATERSPLTVAQITEVFEQLREHPDYDNHTVMSISADGQVVKMTATSIEVVENLFGELV